MAVDYSQYAQIYGGGGQAQQGAAQIGSAIGRGFSAIPNKMDKLAASQSEWLDNAFAPLLTLMSTKVEEWGDVNTSIPSAGQAYMTWVNSLEPREKKIARRGGILDPIRFKQQYDAQMDMYLPSIKQQLEAYRQLTGKSDDKMRDFLSTKQSLNSFLLANTSTEDLATVNQYFKPEKSWKQWWQNKDAVGMPWYTEDVSKAEIPVGGTLAAAGGLRMGRGIAKMGPVAYAKGYSPFGRKGKVTTRQMDKALGKGTRQAIGKELGWAQSKSYKKGVKTAASKAQAQASKAVTDAGKLYNKKPRKYTSGVNKGKSIPWKNTKQYTTLIKKQAAEKLKNQAVKAGVKQGPAKAVGKFIQKHGVRKLFNQVMKKVGWKGAAKLLGKGALSLGMKGSGVGAIASLALDAATIWEISRLIADFNE